VVVLSRSTAVRALRRALVVPCTTTVRGLPSEVALDPREDPLPRPCVASLDSVEAVSAALLVERLGILGDGRMREICAALGVAVDCHG
jgi:mRNA interferase MazF